MKQITPKELPPSFPRQISNSYFKGFRMMKDNLVWGVPLIALEAGMSQPGEKVPVLTGRLAGLAVQPALAGVMAAGTTALIGCPPAAAAVFATLAAAYVSTKLEDPVIRGLKWVTKQGQRARRINFGGDFEDTQTNQARRQRALRDIAGAMPQARQWLGQEGLILHR